MSKPKIKDPVRCVNCGKLDDDRFEGTSVKMRCPDCAAPRSVYATLCRRCCPSNHGTYVYQSINARNEALEEAAGHLELEWTDNPAEREAGVKLAAELRAKIKA